MKDENPTRIPIADEQNSEILLSWFREERLGLWRAWETLETLGTILSDLKVVHAPGDN